MADNAADQGSDVDTGNNSFYQPGVGHNLIGVYDPTVAKGLSTANGDQLGTLASPINPLLGSLANNGGPTQTVALLTGSPAIDAGNNDYRRVNYIRFASPRATSAASGLVGNTVDIGAFELQSTSRVNGRFLFYDNSNYDDVAGNQHQRRQCDRHRQDRLSARHWHGHLGQCLKLFARHQWHHDRPARRRHARLDLAGQHLERLYVQDGQ